MGLGRPPQCDRADGPAVVAEVAGFGRSIMSATRRGQRWLRPLALALCWSAAPAFGQDIFVPAGTGAAGVVLLPPVPQGAEQPPPPPPWVVIPPASPVADEDFWRESKFVYTYLPGGDRRLEINDF